jgi:hypothetical protein
MATLASRSARKSVTQLGWPHYWLLIVILGGMLGIIAMVFLIQTRT